MHKKYIENAEEKLEAAEYLLEFVKKGFVEDVYGRALSHAKG